MKNFNIEDSLKVLGLENKIIEKLEQKDIKIVKQLWLLKRKDLKELDFSDKEINHIRIRLQLCGLDLNKKMYL